MLMSGTNLTFVLHAISFLKASLDRKSSSRLSSGEKVISAELYLLSPWSDSIRKGCRDNQWPRQLKTH